MPTTLLTGGKYAIKDLKAHLKARKRASGTCLAVMAVSLLATPFCFAFSDSSPTPSVQHLFLGISIVQFCLAAVSGGAYGYVWTLNRRDLNAILKSDSIAMVPILAEYHAYFSSGQNDPRLHRVSHTYSELTTVIRSHTIELLRTGGEASQLEFSAGVLTALINMMVYIKDTDDLHLILDVIAAVGAPDCFAPLDIVAGEIHWRMPEADKEAKHRFLLHVAECKTAVRVRQGKAREARFLLRACDAPDTLLRPAYPRLGRSYGEDLLRPSTEQASEEGKQHVGTET